MGIKNDIVVGAEDLRTNIENAIVQFQTLTGTKLTKLTFDIEQLEDGKKSRTLVDGMEFKFTMDDVKMEVKL